MRDFAEYVIARMLASLINLFPLAVSVWIARRIGEAMFLLMPERRRIALKNLTLVFGNSKSAAEKNSLAWESFRHLATSIIEFVRLPKWIKGLRQRFRVQGLKSFEDAYVRGKGVLLAMSHLGPWEYLAYLSYMTGHPAIILGKTIRNPYIHHWVRSLRKMLNLEYSDKAKGIRDILIELKRGHIVAIAIDQWAGNEGLRTQFFGTPTSTTSLPVRLARRSGCALIPAYCIRRACGQYELHLQPELFIRENENNWVEDTTAELNRLLEERIRQHPEQWLWIHRRWKTI